MPYTFGYGGYTDKTIYNTLEEANKAALGNYDRNIPYVLYEVKEVPRPEPKEYVVVSDAGFVAFPSNPMTYTEASKVASRYNDSISPYTYRVKRLVDPES